MQESERRGAADYLYLAALILLLILFTLVLIDYTQTAFSVLRFPYPVEYGEGPILDQTVHLARQENIYHADFSTLPFTITKYPPLFQAFQIPFYWLSGPAYWYGRLISMICALVSAVLLSLITFTLTRDGIAAAVSGLLLAAFPYFAYGAILNLGDSLALAFSLGGLYTIVRKPASRRAIWIASLLFCAAAFTNLLYIFAIPTTAFIWLLLEKQRRNAIWLLCLTLGFSLALTLVINLATGGGYLFNLSTANRFPFSYYPIVEHWLKIFLNTYILILCVLVFLILDRLSRPSQIWSLVIIFLFTAGVSAFSIGRAGASTNTLYPLLAALSLGGAALLYWAREHIWLRIAVTVLLAIQVYYFLGWAQQDFSPQLAGKLGNRRELDQLAQFVQQAPGPVLADEYMGLLPLYDRPISFMPFEFKQLQEIGAWDPASLIQSIQNRDFAAALLHNPRTWSFAIVTRWSPEIRQAIYNSYKHARTLAETLIYLPITD
jgi:hypothetical protein